MRGKSSAFIIVTALLGCTLLGVHAQDLWASGFNNPCALRPIPGEPDSVVVVERTRCKITKVSVSDPTNRLDFLNLGGSCSTGGEQGMLDVNFHPLFGDGTHDYVYIYYTQVNGDVMIERYLATTEAANVSSAMLLIQIPQPYANHNGGTIEFWCPMADCQTRTDMYLMIGDGGSANDPQNYALNLNSTLGKMLRLTLNDDGYTYTTPGNPFTNAQGLEEVYTYGLRNPWRAHFDACGTMWIGDVGQNDIEEIDIFIADDTSLSGASYGWRCWEGTRQTDLPECSDSQYPAPSNNIFPVAEYQHGSDTGRSVTGGHVYRGRKASNWRGSYVFGDYISGKLFRLDGEEDQVVPSPHVPLTLIDTGITMSRITSFGLDNSAELYIVQGNGEIYTLPANPPGSTAADFGNCNGADGGGDGAAGDVAAELHSFLL